MKKYILTLDQGTTSSRCIIWDKSGRAVAKASKAIDCIYPKPGMVEQDAKEIFTSLLQAAREALEKSGVLPGEIAGIGITNQRETTILWDRVTGEPVYNAIGWQCGRGEPYINRVISEGKGELITRKTGLIPNAYFSAGKILWLFDNVPDARKRAECGELLFGTVDSWVLWNLTGGRLHATDFTNASRTLYFNIDTLSWDKELLEIFDIPECILPEALPSSGFFADTDGEIFGEPVPVFALAGDQQASLYGQCCFATGDTKITYGTGCFMLMNTGKKRLASHHGLLTTLTAGSEAGSPEYALEGSAFMGGATVQWLRDGLGIIRDAAETEAAALSVPDSGGVYMVPAFAGLGAPYWVNDATGLITGLTRGTRREHVIRAALEGICYQNADVLSAMESDSGARIKQIMADGGASDNDFLMQFQANVTGSRIIRPKEKESTAQGAAFLAGIACGFWESEKEVAALTVTDKEYAPVMDEERRGELLRGWKAAVHKVMTHENTKPA